MEYGDRIVPATWSNTAISTTWVSKTSLARWIFDYGTGPVRLLFAKNRENFFESWVAMRKPVRFASGKYFVEQDTERIDISRLGHGLAPGLLGCSRNGR